MNENEYKENTIVKSKFKEVSVRGDGACLYRCLIRYMVDIQKHINNNPNFKIVFDDINIKEGGAAKNLQFLIKDWLYKNKDEKLDDFMNFDGTIGDFVLIDHEEIPNMEIYNELYSIFAGDEDYLISESDETNIKGDKLYEKVYIPLRWGGMSELYAFNKIFDININQYIGVRWNKSKQRMDNCEFDKKDRRYRLIQKIGIEDNNLEVNLLFNNSEKLYRRHYTYLRLIKN
jgi:hypothetical protein